tara:strand:- start:1360 stop:1968 length:609 start_codon:yes stop_codon:yes gene_type:complete
MNARVNGLLKDIGLFALVLLHWTIVSAIVDASTNNVDVRKGVSVWIFVFAAIVNGISITRSWLFLGSNNGPPETIVGLFFEIVNLTNVWGSAFAVSRYFSRDREVDLIFNQTLLAVEFESFVEMGLVNAGVGFTSLLPETVFERVVTWLAALVGGVLVTSMFLLSVVLSRRGFWDRSYEPVVTPPVTTTGSNNLTFTLGRPK